MNAFIVKAQNVVPYILLVAMASVTEDAKLNSVNQVWDLTVPFDELMEMNPPAAGNPIQYPPLKLEEPTDKTIDKTKKNRRIFHKRQRKNNSPNKPNLLDKRF